MSKIITYLKKEIVLTVASALAVISMFFVPPSTDYLDYIDFSVIGLLFCLMIVVAGFTRSGFFEFLSEFLLEKFSSLKSICAALTLLCFFMSMLITNDVALITFVPLTISLLSNISTKQLAYIITLETVAANLGSILTPIGNPQNLYLYSYFNLHIGEFLKTVFPVFALSLVFIIILLMFVKNQKTENTGTQSLPLNKKLLLICTLLFCVDILCVLRFLDYKICLAVTIGVVLIFAPRLFAKVDYGLLVTFLAFFIFVGNMGNIETVKEFLITALRGRELFVSAAVSQVISNVPAAVMLSGFTENVRELLLGVNIGGLGTLVASLASLISYKFYVNSKGAKPLVYLGIFTAVNLVLLIILLAFAFLFLI